MNATHTLVQLAFKALLFAGAGLHILACLYALREATHTDAPSVTTDKAACPPDSTVIISSTQF